MESSCLMKLSWKVTESDAGLLRSFLKGKGISKRLLAKIKFQGGELKVNGINVTVLQSLNEGDEVEAYLPEEKNNERLIPSYEALDILYEDDHYLVVNKPVGVAAVPSPTHREETMANRVKGHTMSQIGGQAMVHVVTRLDRNTSGAMIFAKHSFAHAQLDQQLRSQKLIKKYLTVVEGAMTEKEHRWIDAPIARSEDSIITRIVDDSGKEALTEYWVKKTTETHSLVDVMLHTGRTHQIRVHFSHIGFPLVGDTLYGGNPVIGMERQALHCASISFYDLFTDTMISVDAPLPDDMEQWIKRI